MIFAAEIVAPVEASAKVWRSRSWLSAWGMIASIGIFALAIWAQSSAVEAQPPLVARVHGIATGIAGCWRPPHDDDQVT
ncbi:MAG: hypothetical protein JOY52_12780, partial [Hyphomicrobiales bacterium]|nr:hypothetical protein [Hyphomicrobiales bacterium]